MSCWTKKPERRREMEKDYLTLLREKLEEYRKLEQEFIAAHPFLAEAEEENYSDSCIWTRYPLPDAYPGMTATRIREGIGESPNMNLALAGVLEAIFENKAPNSIRLESLYADTDETLCRFCISGSISVRELQKTCENHPLILGQTRESENDR